MRSHTSTFPLMSLTDFKSNSMFVSLLNTPQLAGRKSMACSGQRIFVGQSKWYSQSSTISFNTGFPYLHFWISLIKCLKVWLFRKQSTSRKAFCYYKKHYWVEESLNKICTGHFITMCVYQNKIRNRTYSTSFSVTIKLDKAWQLSMLIMWACSTAQVLQLWSSSTYSINDSHWNVCKSKALYKKPRLQYF